MPAPWKVFLLLFCSAAGPAFAQAVVNRPVFSVDAPSPTKDKPQSKLWFAQDVWWAWLPVRGGSAIWKRTASGWQRQTDLDDALRHLPGQADVWADAEGVGAVLVEGRRLAFVRLRWNGRANAYRRAAEPQLFRMPDDPDKSVLETATIARDHTRRWWIGYGWQRRMWVRASRDKTGAAWTEPIEISRQEASADDICVLAALPGGVALLWSDQAHEAVYFRQHDGGPDATSWKPAEVAAQGGKTADDHLNMAIGAGGALWAATKNSVDRIGEPQLVLRIRDPRGRWTNVPYAPRAADREPSRPIALLGGRPQRLFLLHTFYLRGLSRPQSVIAWQSTGLQRLDLSATARPLMGAAARINDVTGCKAILPDGKPWIVLASDPEGNVYEADLRAAP